MEHLDVKNDDLVYLVFQ